MVLGASKKVLYKYFMNCDADRVLQFEHIRMKSLRSSYSKVALAVTPIASLFMLVTSALAAPLSDDATTIGEASVAAALDSAPASELSEKVRSLSSTELRADGLGQLSTKAFANLPRISIDAMDFSDRQLRGYLGDRRLQAQDISKSAQYTGFSSLRIGFNGVAWENIYDAKADRERYKVRDLTLRINADIAPIPNLIVGVSAGVDAIDMRLNPIRKPRSTQFNYYFGPYVSFTNGMFYVDGAVGYNYADYNLRREVNIGGLTDKLVSKAEGDGWSASTEVGAHLRIGKVRVQPNVGLSYRYADITPFRENGGTSAVIVNSFNAKSVRGTIGAKVGVEVKRGAWSLQPSFDAQLQHEFRERPESQIRSRFVTGSTRVMVSEPARYARNVANLGFSVTASHRDNYAVRIGYVGQVASDRHSHAATLTLSRRL